MKILYACSNNLNAKIQADRFLSTIKDSNLIVKVSAYRNFLPDSGCDWTLDPLLVIGRENPYLFERNKYLEIYSDQIKSYNPDLIISDLEIYSSYVALILGKELWHVSNRLHNFAIDHLFKSNINVFKFYKTLYEASHFYHKINEIISAANKNFLYSHFCDMNEKIDLKKGFNWVRPYYYSSKKSEAHRHKYVGFNSDYSIVKFLSSKKNDCVLFSLKDYTYDNLICKKYLDIEEYSCNVANCDYYVCNGSASLMADAFYNTKNFIIVKDHYNIDNLFNHHIYHKIYNFLIENDEVIIPSEIDWNYNVNFLHEIILKKKDNNNE